MRKAVIFSLDAIVAALFATTLLATIVLSANSAEAEHSPVITLRQNAEDALASMDKRGILKNVFSQSDDAAHASLYSFLNSTLPTHLGANITLEAFEYETGGSCSVGCRVDGATPASSFCTCKRISNSTATACSAADPCRQASRARRMFYEFVSNKDWLGRATLDVWTKGN